MSHGTHNTHNHIVLIKCCVFYLFKKVDLNICFDLLFFGVQAKDYDEG